MRIGVHRGDIYYACFVVLNPDETPVDIDFDTVYFTVKKCPKTKVVIFQKSLAEGTIVKVEPGTYQLKIEPEDTSTMSFGKYAFDIQFEYKNGLSDVIKETFRGDFDVLEEVTYPENERGVENGV